MVEFDKNWAAFGQSWPHLGQIQIKSSSTKAGLGSATQVWPEFYRVWRAISQLRHEFGNLQVALGQVRPNSTPTSQISAQGWPNLARSRLSRARLLNKAGARQIAQGTSDVRSFEIHACTRPPNLAAGPRLLGTRRFGAEAAREYQNGADFEAPCRWEERSAKFGARRPCVATMSAGVHLRTICRNGTSSRTRNGHFFVFPPRTRGPLLLLLCLVTVLSSGCTCEVTSIPQPIPTFWPVLPHHKPSRGRQAQTQTAPNYQKKSSKF